MRHDRFRRHLVLAVLTCATVMLIGSPASARTAGDLVACPEARPGYARCLTVVERTAVAGAPAGLGADQLRSAYEVPNRTSDTTVAVVIWHNAPNLAQDLAAYRSQYGLGPCAMTDGCLRIVNQRGTAAPLPVNDPAAVETTLDVSMVSAACPSCHILVVEARNSDATDLAAAERTAVRLGATVVSNSFGIAASGADLTYENAYRHRGVVTVAASGDSGFADTEAPAVYPGVLAVGGVELSRAAGTKRGWTESAWLYGSSGCSAYFAEPAWQHHPGCSRRLTADLSAAADNIAIYDTGLGGWATIAGTSAAAPFVAGLIGLAGNAPYLTVAAVYRHASDFHDVTTGTDDIVEGGKACGRTLLCVAAPGYDGPTGLGTPDGIRGL